MSSKSHVGMGHYLCPVTGQKHSETVLLDRRLRETLDRDNCLGWKASPDVMEKMEEGYVPVVEVDYDRSEKTEDGNLTPQGAWRTGKIGYIKREAWPRIFNTECNSPMAFVQEGLLEQLGMAVEE